MFVIRIGGEWLHRDMDFELLTGYTDFLYSSPHWTQSSGYMGGVFVYTCRSSLSV